MNKSEARKLLAKAFGGDEKEAETFDPEMFLLRLGLSMANQQKVLAELMAHYKSVENTGTKKEEELVTKINEIVESVKQQQAIHKDVLTAIAEKKVEQVIVEKVIERSPESIKVNLAYPEQKARDKERAGLFGKVKDAIGSLFIVAQSILAEIRASREPNSAIAVRLVDSKGDNFYNAIMTVVGGGGAFNDTVLNATFVTKTVDFTASQTAQTIWTPTAGKRFAITDYHLSFSGAGAITVFDGTDDTANRVVKYNGAANGGANHSYRKPRISSAANNVLKYTTGAGAVGSLTIEGYEV